MKWLIVLLGMAANAAASVLIKVAVTPPRPAPSFREPAALLTNWPLWLGLAFYGVTFLLYSVALTRLPLNIAHPLFTSGAMVIVAFCSVLVFGEAFYWTTAAGLLLVIAGLWLITLHVR
jgi:small multidrug resistance pump